LSRAHGSAAQRAAVFLDRDGTLLDELGFLARPADLRLLPGAAAGVRALNQAGLAVVLVTNQSGIARGLFSEADLAAIHARLAQELERAGAHLDALYHCPHHPEQGQPPLRRACSCRKPEPGLLLLAARELGLDLARSWIVGDSVRDLEAGRRAGIPGRVLVLTGKGQATLAGLAPEQRAQTLVVADLPEAARRVLAQGR
jgi:D-glycero-D-manno-heptose 1,7-bisphosphate phosphatase